MSDPLLTRRAEPGAVRASGTQLDEITELIDSGALRPIVDQTYPFDEAPQALAHVEGGRTKGKVVITMV
jgi:NADPH:quinone reductase-like Zn-dependent oxidoreductase